MGVHRGDVSRIERGEHSITTAKREQLTKHFGWSASKILDRDHAAHIPVCGTVGEGGAIIPAEGVSLMTAESLREPGDGEFAGCEHVDMPPGEYPLDLACVRVAAHVMRAYSHYNHHISKAERQVLYELVGVLTETKDLTINTVRKIDESRWEE